MVSGSKSLECFFDGACKGNQFARKGPMWVAYVIGEEEHVHEIPDVGTARGPERSNNLAEYRALVLLLSRLHELGAERASSRIVVSGDSQLVVYQMLGRYRVQDAKLAPLHAEASRLAADLPITFRWVPRDRNRAGHLLE